MEHRYTFEYPTNWKSEVVNKVSKGTQGVDGRVFNVSIARSMASVA